MLEFELAKGELDINVSIINKTVKVFGRLAGLIGKKSFSLALVDARTMKKWNLAYRGQDKATDVLSFAQYDTVLITAEDRNDLGEILICLPVAKRQAKEYGFDLDYEICRLLIHGLAHLVGYEHEDVSKAKAEKMRRFEKKVIESIFKK